MLESQILEDQWSHIKSAICRHWDQISDADLEQTNRDANRVVDLVTQKTPEWRGTVERVLQEAVESATTATGRVRDTAGWCADDAVDTVSAMRDTAANQMDAVCESVSSRVRQNPVASLGVGLGAGIVAGVVVGLMLNSGD